MSKKERNNAILQLAKATGHMLSGKPDDYCLAEIKKYATVRELIDKSDGTVYIYSTYGTYNGATGYFSLNTKDNEIISGDKAEEYYHKSKTWYR